MSDAPWIVILWPVLMLGVIVVAAVYKYIEVNNARSWRSAPGVVVKSGVEARKVKAMDNVRRTDGGGTETRNFANVTYEYELFGKTLRNNRVSIGEDAGNFDVEETLARYPVGTKVTVYYNPKNPKQAVLEREAPRGMWGCITGGVVVLLVGYAVTLFGFSHIYDALKSVLPRSEHPGFVIALVAFGLVAALFAEGLRRSVNRTKSWPAVPGRIETAEVEQFEGTIGSDSRGRRPQTLYRSNVLYSYTVGGRTYRGSKIGSHGTVTANVASMARNTVAAFKVGEPVTVHYDPNNPSDAVVNPAMPRVLWLIWLVPLGCFVGAYFIAS